MIEVLERRIMMSGTETPTSLTATVVSRHEIDLAWTDVDPAGGAGIIVERSSDGGNTFAALTTLPASATSYHDTNFQIANQYTYRVVALNGDVAGADLAAAETSGATPTDPNGPWAYGYRGALADTALTLDPDQTSAWDGVSAAKGWFVNEADLVPADVVNTSSGDITFDFGAGPLHPDEMLVHPGLGGATAYNVVRWTAPANGTYQIDAEWRRIHTGGTDVHVVAGGQTIWSGSADLSATDPSQAANLTLGLTAGETVDFVVGRGADNNYGGDSTAFTASVLPSGAAVVSNNAVASTFPAAPTGLTATAVSAHEIDLTWNNAHSAGSAGFILERSSDGGSTFAAVTTLPASATSYHDTSLQSAGQFTYRVVAMGGDVAGADLAAAETSGATPTDPAGPWTYGYRGAIADTALTLDPDNTAAWDGVSAVKGWYINESDLVPADVVNTSSSDVNFNFGVAPLHPGEMLVHPGQGGANAYNVVRWTAPADGTYQINAGWRRIGTGGTDVHIVAAGQTVWNGSSDLSAVNPGQAASISLNLTAGETVEFVVGSGADGNYGGDSTAFSASVVATNQSLASNNATASTLPAAPSGLTATPVGSSEIDLVWTPDSTDTNGFVLERSADGTTFSAIANLPAGAASYSDTGLASGSHLTYQLIALGGAVAGADLAAAETSGATPIDPSGPWTYGYRGALADTALTLDPDNTAAWDGVSAVKGWFINETDLVPADVVNTSASDVNFDFGAGPLHPGEMLVHPGQGGATAYNVVRWTAPADGAYRIDAQWRRIHTGGTDVHVVAGGQTVWNGSADLSATNPSQSANLTLNLTAGETVEFVVGSGADGNYGGDSTAFNAAVIRADQAVVSGTAAATVGSLGIANAAAASLSANHKGASLSILGATTGAESALTYQWSVVNGPSGASAPQFAADGTNAAKNTSVTFSLAGTYTLLATVTDPTTGLTAASSVNVTIAPVFGGISITPSAVAINVNGTQQFVAAGLDQFGSPLSSQPSFNWSLTGGSGTVSAAGLYRAASTAGSATVSAASGSISAAAHLSISNAPPVVAVAAAASSSTVSTNDTALSVLGSDDLGESSLSYTWSLVSGPAGVSAPTFTVNGNNAAKTTDVHFFGAGSYTFQVTLNDGVATTTSTTTVTVASVLAGVSVTPPDPALSPGGVVQFQAYPADQFGNAIAAPLSWTVTQGAGSISQSGLYTAPTTAGQATIVVVAGTGSNIVTGSASIIVDQSTPGFALTAPFPVQIQPNVTFTSSLGAFSDPGVTDPNSFTASIQWGDGTAAAPVTIYTEPWGPKQFLLRGAHEYSAAGSYSAVITVTDKVTGQTIQGPVDVEAGPPLLYLVPGSPGQMTAVTITRSGPVLAAYNNELGIYFATGADGGVGGKVPGDAGFPSAALTDASSHAVLRTRSPNGTTYTINAPAGTYLGLYMVQDNTIANAIAGNPNDLISQQPLTFFPSVAANPDAHYAHFQQVTLPGGGVRYYYGVEDLSYGGDQDFNDLQFTINAAAAAPVLTATADDTNLKIHLSWQNSFPSTQSFLIERSIDGINFTALTTVSNPSATSYDDLTAAIGVTYYYRITAMDGQGDSSPTSNVASAVVAVVGQINGRKFDSSNPPPASIPPSGSVHLQTIANVGDASGIDYYEPDNTVLVSEEGGSSSFVEVHADGTTTPFSNVTGISGEGAVVTVRSGDTGGFTVGDVFASDGTSNQILRISNSGQTVMSPWVSLPGGVSINALTLDRTGLYGGDLIASTQNGQVWLIDSHGNFALLASLPQTSGNFEASIALPDDSTKWGPFAGDILVAADDSSGKVYAIDPHGSITAINAPDALEYFQLVPANENFFGADVQGNVVAGPASDFAQYAGDLLMVQEETSAFAQFPGLSYDQSGLFTLAWNGTALVSTPVNEFPGGSVVYGWERFTFAPAGLPSLPATQPGLSGWTIDLEQPNQTGQLQVLQSTVTDQNGNYSFTNLAPGTYTVAEVGQSGWAEDVPGSGTYQITVGNGTAGSPSVINGVDFGNHQLPPPGQTPNSPPIITSVPPTTLQEGQQLSYAVTATDPDGDTPLTYDLPFAPAGMTIDPTTHVITWDSGQTVGYVSTVVRVTDPFGNVAMQPFTVLVSAANLPAPPQNFQANAVSTSEIDLSWNSSTNAATYNLYRSTTSGFSPSSLTLIASGLSTLAYQDQGLPASTTYYYLVTAVDASQHESIPSPQAQAATWTSATGIVVTGTPATSVEGISAYILAATFTDSAAGLPDTAYTATIDWGDGSAPSQGDILATATGYIVRAAHAYAEEGTQTATVTVTRISDQLSAQATAAITISDAPLSAVSGTVTTSAGQLASGTIARFSDQNPSPDIADFSALINWGDGTTPTAGTIVSDPSGGFDVVGSHTYAQQGQYTATTTVTDVGGSTASAAAAVTVSAPTAVPQVTALTATPNPVTGTGVQLSVTAIDPAIGNASDLTYGWTLFSAPTGASSPSISSGSVQSSNLGLVLSAPVAYIFQITVTSPTGVTTEQLPVQVNSTFTSIVVAPLAMSVADGSTQTYVATALDQFGIALATQPTFTWSAAAASGGAAAGGVNSSSGVYTAPASGSGQDVVSASAAGGSGTIVGAGSAFFTSGAPAQNSPPVITNTPPGTTVTVGGTYTYTVAAFAPGGGAVTFSLGGAASGAGAVLTDNGNGTATLTWTPAASGSVLPVVIVASANGQSVTQGFTVIAQAPAGPVVQPIPNPMSIVAGSAFQFQVQATPPTGDTITNYQLTNAPPGLTISSTTGLISGTPPTADARPQPYPVQVVVTDGQGGSTTQSFSFLVTVNNTPTVRLTASNTSVPVGGSITFHVQTTDGGATATPALTVNGQTVTLDSSGNGTWTAPSAVPSGAVSAIATATDPTTNTAATESISINVYDPSAVAGTPSLHVPDDQLIILDNLPVNLMRVYDTASAGTAGDFGFGWSLNLGIAGALQLNGAPNLDHDGQKVTVTLPNGAPETFTFSPVFQGDQDQSLPTTAFYAPAFTSTSGSGDTLTADDGASPAVQIYKQQDDTRYVTDETDFFDQTPYQPNTFTLTTSNGVKYHFDNNGNILSITDPGNASDPAGDKVDFSSFASTGQILGYTNGVQDSSIVVSRDAANGNRITGITDAGSTFSSYGYDSATGDLTSATDPTGTTAYGYDSTHAHYLESAVRTPAGGGAAQDILTATYDTSGNATSATDVNHLPLPVVYNNDPTHPGTLKTISHELSDGSLLVTTFKMDGNGDVLKQTNPDGDFVDRTFDGVGNATSVTAPRKVGDPVRMTFITYANAQLGEASTVTDPQGDRSSFVWNNGQPVTGTGPDGATATSSYNSDGQPSASVDADGNTTTTIYEEFNGNPQGEKIVSGPGGTTTFVYDDSQIADGIHIIDETGPNGVTTVSRYDLQYRLLSFYDPTGQVQTYDASGNLTSSTSNGIGTSVIRNPDGTLQSTTTGGQTTSYTYTPQGLLDKTIYPATQAGGQQPYTENTYDAAGRVIATRDVNGYWTQFTLDRDGRVIRTTLPDKTLNDPSDPATQQAYDSAGRVIASTDAYGNRTQFVYNSLDQVIQTNFFGSLDPTTHSPVWSAATVYDANGRVVYQQDKYLAGMQPTGSQTFYDANGNAVRTDRLSNLQIAVTQDSQGLWQSSFTSDGGITTTQETIYDGANRPVATLDAHVPGQTAYATLTTYDSAGNAIETQRVLGAAVDPTTGAFSYTAVLSTSYASYDSAGRVVTQTGPDHQTTIDQYDGNGNLTDTYDALGDHTHTDYDSTSGRVLDSIDALGTETGFAYDAAGNLTTTTFDVDGLLQSTAVDTYDANGNKISSQDQLGRVTSYAYGGASNQLASVTMPQVLNPATGQMVNPVYTYGYDLFGNENSQSDAAGNVTTMGVSYDASGDRTETTTLPFDATYGTRTESTTYDPLGRLMQSVDFEGQVTRYTYDASTGLLSAKNFYRNATDAANGILADSTSYTYDALGRQQTVTDSTGVTTYSYDADGNVTQVAAPNGTIHYVYDPATDRKTETWTGADRQHEGTDTFYGYDALGRLATTTVTVLNGVTLTASQITTDTYDPNGNKTAELLPNGTLTAYTYNVLNQLTDETVTNASGTTLLHQQYTLALNGRRDALAETELQSDGSTSTITTTWSYDNLDHLTEEKIVSSLSGGSSDTSYTYDLAGNRKTETSNVGGQNLSLTDTYNADDELTAENGTVNGVAYQTTYTYDANGSLVGSVRSGSGTSSDGYSYNVRGQLSSVNLNGVITNYTYDDAGNRVSETTNGTTTYLLTDSNNLTGYSQILEQSETQGGLPTISYAIGDHVLGQGSAGAASWLVTDGHGSTRFLTNVTGAVSKRYNYDAFGNPVGFDPNTALTSVLYAGQQWDGGAGQYNLRARDYDPSTGRFSSFDSYQGNSSDPLSLHKYLYAGNNAVNAWDPSGHDFSISELAVDAGISNILGGITSPIISPAINYIANALIPQSVVDAVLGAASADAITVGATVGANLPLGSLPVGITFGGGAELLWSPKTHNAALYGFIGGGLNFGSTKSSAGLSGSIGLVWGTPTSTDYTKHFLTLSVPFASIQKALQQKIETQLLYVATQSVTVLAQSASGDVAFYRYEVNTLSSVTQTAVSDLGNTSSLVANFFFDPTLGGSVGVSLSRTLLGTPNSSSNVSLTYSYYWQLRPAGSVSFR